ncbi:MAG: 2-oxo acid dehydrogenase subunit E2 [Deltaproteobacteria bacterium]|nr:MAG: 2-oxo acid dehydrogenase subunit E2 [Deltaproteobacteria bacterium]
MAYEFKLPDIGEGVVEGEIVQWLVQEGDRVREDQPLLEIMTDKATVAIPSPKAGVVKERRGKEGDVVAVGETLVVIDTGDGVAAGDGKASAQAASAAPAQGGGEATAAAKTSTPKVAPQSAAPAPEADAPSEEAPQTRPTDEAAHALDGTPPARLVRGLPARTTSPLAGRIAPGPRRPAAAARVRAAPSVRRQARELGIDLSQVAGSGPGGRVTDGDLARVTGRGPNGATAAATPAPTAQQLRKGPPYNVPEGVALPPPGGETRVPFRGVRKVIAKRMQEAKNTAAHFTFVEEVDMRALVALREELKPVAAEQGVKLNYLPFFVKAAVIALMRHPQLNMRLDAEREELVYQGHYDIGIATATDRGLVVPVVKNADHLSIVEIGAEIARLAQAARDGTITREEMTGSTFTITSLGQQAGLFATPVINLPNVAIMGPHQIKDKPIVENGAIVPGKTMLLSLSFDHRLIDGHVGAAFAYEVIGLLEHPERLMLAMR